MQKHAILITVDCFLISLAFWLAITLQLPAPDAARALQDGLIVLPALLGLSAVFSFAIGVSGVQLKAYEGAAIGATAIFAGLMSISSLLLGAAFGVTLPWPVHLVFGMYFFVFSVISRAVLLQLVLVMYRLGKNRCRVLIYGAGTTGVQLVSALRTHEQIDPIAFVDDNFALQGRYVARLPVFSPRRIQELVADRRIDRVLLAMPSQSQPKLAQIARRIERFGVEVQTLPSFSQLVGEEPLVEKLQPTSPSKFLNREEVSEGIGDSANAYQSRSVLISGAGGSIGSELCRQVLECKPARLVLFEMSELALYQIHQEMLQATEGTFIEIVPVLGSVADAIHVRRVLAEYEIQVVLHAAAYKHVPLVEANPVPGLSNNVLGTQVLATEATRARVERFILISSDKAVRPTNMMGASKRLAELVVQDLASRVPVGEGPRFAIVRFGNVLGSSGSVIPLFQEQVRRGGPVTVTHRDVSRFFMTVQEAVHLVLQAGASADGGEVYVLDMGKPVRIVQLARQVIESAGCSVRDLRNPDGDIEIAYTGLRPGEKMTEELCISGVLVGTSHRKIFRAIEEKLSQIEVASALRDLRDALTAGDEIVVRALVQRWVDQADTPAVAATSADQRVAEMS